MPRSWPSPGLELTTPRSGPGVRSGVGCLTNRASRGPENHTAFSCVSVTSFEIGKCCVPLCLASPTLMLSGVICGGGWMLWFFFFPISKICHHDFDKNDIETEGGFRNCGHFHKMRLPPHEPGTASQSLVWLSAQVLCPFGSVSLFILCDAPEKGVMSFICFLSAHCRDTARLLSSVGSVCVP